MVECLASYICQWLLQLFGEEQNIFKIVKHLILSILYFYFTFEVKRRNHCLLKFMVYPTYFKWTFNKKKKMNKKWNTYSYHFYCFCHVDPIVSTLYRWWNYIPWNQLIWVTPQLGSHCRNQDTWWKILISPLSIQTAMYGKWMEPKVNTFSEMKSIF